MTELATAPAEIVVAPEVVLSNRDLDLIRRQVNIPKNGRAPNDVELEDFARYCIAQRLNPFDRQIYLAHIGGRWQPFTGVHGRLVIALRTGEVVGMEGPFYCHSREGRERLGPPDWDEVWDEEEPPRAAKFVVYRRGWDRHPVGVAPWRYYNRGIGVWVSNPPLMLGYKAITRALNLVFPDVMPPSPDRPDDEPDIDESTGYVRDDPDDGQIGGGGTPSPEMIDAKAIAAEFDLTPTALLVELRRLATELRMHPPTKISNVPADLVETFRRRR
jgi:hypothetical protein